MKKQQKCYIYTRVSTAIQVDGYSSRLSIGEINYNQYKASIRDTEASGEILR